MINIETLDHETKLYTLICGLLSLDLSEPTFFEKLGDYGLVLTNKEQNIGALRYKLIKYLCQSCKSSRTKRNVVELVNSLGEIARPEVSLELQILLDNRSNHYKQEIRVTAVNNYIRRFKFFYLRYFNNLRRQNTTQKDLNTLAIWALFFLLT